MSCPIEQYLERRFLELEAKDFRPIASSPCWMVAGTIETYRALPPDDRVRYRRMIARSRAAIWTGQKLEHTTADAAWYSRFLQSFPPPTYPERHRELAKANELRKVAKLCFEQLLGATPRKSENPGDWLYEGMLLGVPISVELRYALTPTQLSYGIHAAGMRSGHRLSTEMFYGLGVGSWNRVYLSEIDQSFALLRDLVEMFVRDHIAITTLVRSGESKPNCPPGSNPPKPSN